MAYFDNCKTIEDVKKLYRKLALEFHPDRGGNTETMQSINNAYSFAVAKLAKGTQFESDEIKISEDFQKIINELINLEGLTIDIVGNWLWVHGDTRPHKDMIKSVGLWWANKKKMWYYRPANFKGGRGTKTYEQITNKYGKTTVKNSTQGGTNYLKFS